MRRHGMLSVCGISLVPRPSNMSFALTTLFNIFLSEKKTENTFRVVRNS